MTIFKSKFTGLHFFPVKKPAAETSGRMVLPGIPSKKLTVGLSGF